MRPRGAGAAATAEAGVMTSETSLTSSIPQVAHVGVQVQHVEGTPADKEHVRVLLTSVSIPAERMVGVAVELQCVTRQLVGENLALRAAVAKLGGTIHRATEAVVVVQRLVGCPSTATPTPSGTPTPTPTPNPKATSASSQLHHPQSSVPRKAVAYLARLKNILEVVEDSCAAAASLEPLDLEEVSEHVRREAGATAPATPGRHDVAAVLEDGL